MSAPYPYAYSMAPRYDEAPEVTPQGTWPEVHHPPVAPEVYSYNQQPGAPFVPIKQDIPAAFTSTTGIPAAPHGSTPYGYGYNGAASGVPSEPGRPAKRAGTLCGCSTTVFVLSVIIAVLSAAVIGLAAGTGIEASRANDAETKLAAAVAAAAASPDSKNATSTTAPTTNYNALDRNCSSNSASVSGTSYTSTFFNKAKYTIYCNKDAPNTPLQSLFVGNFDDCMDACSAYSHYMPLDFSNTTATANQTCAAVSFIPAWTNRTKAIAGDTPGNCYLHGGPQNRTALSDPKNGSETHAAIVAS